MVQQSRTVKLRLHRLKPTVWRSPRVHRTAARRQALLPTPPPNSCRTRSPSSAGTHQWRSSTASCTFTRPSELQLTCLFVSSGVVYCFNMCCRRCYCCSKMTSLTEDVRRSAMVCILTVPATMTSHDLMKLLAPFNEVMEHMKIIRDSTPNQYMVLIKFCTQVRSQQNYDYRCFFVIHIFITFLTK